MLGPKKIIMFERKKYYLYNEDYKKENTTFI